MMESKKIFSVLMLLIITISSVSFALAASDIITGSIGNSRMILRLNTGDQIEKSVRVINVNDVSVEINISVTGDLQQDITLKDESFILGPGEEKKAYFTIDVKESGTTETSINVQFSPVDGKNGVGLSSTVIVIANGTSQTSQTGGEKEGNSTTMFNVFNVFNLFNSDEKDSMNPGMIVVILLFILLILMVVFLFVLRVTKPKKEVQKK